MRKKLENMENEQKRKLDQQARRVRILALLRHFNTALLVFTAMHISAIVR